MKKLAIISLAALLVVAFTMPAAAFENIFGGYWRTRCYTEQNYFGGEDSRRRRRQHVRSTPVPASTTRPSSATTSSSSTSSRWTRSGVTRIRPVTATSAPTVSSVEVKNSYVDFDMGPVNAKIGVQGFILARGFLADDDFAGAHVAYKNDLMSLPVFWFKAYEGGTDNNTADTDIFGIAPSFSFGDSSKLTAYGVYWMSDNLEDYQTRGGTNLPVLPAPVHWTMPTSILSVRTST